MPIVTAYIVTNRKTGRQYVGITRSGVEARWKQHIAEAARGRRGAIKGAIRKYGPSLFAVESVASSNSWIDACAIERILILQHNTRAPNGYNLTPGGDGVTEWSPTDRAKLSAALRGRRHTDAAKLAIGLASRGHVVSDEARKAIGAARRGKPLSVEHRRKLSIAKIGKRRPPRTPAHSEGISEGLKRAWRRRKMEAAIVQSLLFGI